MNVLLSYKHYNHPAPLRCWLQLNSPVPKSSYGTCCLLWKPDSRAKLEQKKKAEYPSQFWNSAWRLCCAKAAIEPNAVVWQNRQLWSNCVTPSCAVGFVCVGLLEAMIGCRSVITGGSSSQKLSWFQHFCLQPAGFSIFLFIFFFLTKKDCPH